jgi:hypothetical protein
LLKARIFISCGQRGKINDPESEAEVAKQIQNKLAELDFEPYLAIEQHSLNGFNENILPKLESSEYYIMIDFRREKITDDEFRGSLFVHQELAIATFLRKEHALIFQEKGVSERDGVKRFMQCNPISFEDKRSLVGLIVEKIISEGWHTGWRNELKMERPENEHEELFYEITNSRVRFFHITVSNRHDNKTAHECLVYLSQILNLETNEIRRPPQVELKWKPMKPDSVAILPNQQREFDALYVECDNPNVIYFGINRFLVDSDVFNSQYELAIPGTYEIQFEIVSREFTPFKSKFRLHFGTTLEELRLTAV